MPISEVLIGSEQLRSSNLHDLIVLPRKLEVVARLACSESVIRTASFRSCCVKFGGQEKVKTLGTDPATKIQRSILNCLSKAGHAIDGSHAAMACAVIESDLDIWNEGFRNATAVGILS